MRKLRHAYDLRSLRQRLLDRGFVPSAVLGQELGVTQKTIHNWASLGFLEYVSCDKRSNLYRIADGKQILKGQGSPNPKPPEVIDLPLSFGDSDVPAPTSSPTASQ